MAKPELKNEEKKEIKRIGETPFHYVTDNDTNYIVSGKVVLETNKTIEEVEERLNGIPWEEICLLCQAVLNEMSNDKKQ